MDESLGFQISDLSRLMRRRFDDRARTIGVTRPQWRTLKLLDRHEGIHQGGLAELLEVEPITCCRMIDRMEEAGLVERRRDPSDRRAWRIHLTARSRPLLDQLRTLADALIEEALAGLGAAERRQFSETLDRIRTNLSAVDTNRDTAHG